MITKATLMTDLMPILDAANVCADAREWLQSHIDSDPNISCGETLKRAVADQNFKQGWAVWCIKVTIDITDVGFRKELLKRVVDPMLAFSMYFKLATLTESEDAELLKKFEGKLPETEKQLKNGEIKRKKDE